MPEPEVIQQAALSPQRLAKETLDEAEKEFAHAQRIGQRQALIAFGSLLQCARVYLWALETWAEGAGDG